MGTAGRGHLAASAMPSVLLLVPLPRVSGAVQNHSKITQTSGFCLRAARPCSLLGCDSGVGAHCTQQEIHLAGKNKAQRAFLWLLPPARGASTVSPQHVCGSLSVPGTASRCLRLSSASPGAAGAESAADAWCRHRAPLHAHCCFGSASEVCIDPALSFISKTVYSSLLHF